MLFICTGVNSSVKGKRTNAWCVLMNDRNIIGPTTVSYGTQDKTSAVDDAVPSSTTSCFCLVFVLYFKKSSIKWLMFPLTPNGPGC